MSMLNYSAYILIERVLLIMKKASNRIFLGMTLASILVTAVTVALLTNSSKTRTPSSNNTIHDKCQVTANTNAYTTINSNESTKESVSITNEINNIVSLKGKITYESSDSTPKADGEAKVLLIPAQLSKDDIFFDDICLFSNGRDFDRFRSRYSFATKANSNGDYEFGKIPKGKYVIIYVSNNLPLKATENKNGSIPDSIILRPLTEKQKALLTPLATVLNKNLDELSLLLFRLSNYDIAEVEISGDNPLVLNLNLSDKVK